jgi:FlaG/FlaF family flagellin (archaellin)
MRKTLIAAIVIVLIAVISVGYLGYTYLLGQNHAVNNPPAQTSNAVENLRDQAMTYLAANHTQTIPIMPTSHWSGGRVGTGLVGAELYQYTNGE